MTVHVQVKDFPASKAIVSNSNKPLSVLLKEKTTTDHESLDRRIMRADPFGDPGRYQGFLKMQYCFHWMTAPLYHIESLNQWIPNLSDSCRLEQVIQDCLDLGITKHQLEEMALKLKPAAVNKVAALGWLYTLEGSNLGAAFLFKHAKAIGFSATYGAAHLAGHSEGRGRHWRMFKSCLDAIPLNDDDIAMACAGGQSAFQYVRNLVEQHLP
ncbi:biliverdin-producing heme oxygenase [Hahella ganghwensis]|uniref:biliverdin-producing heme oxygenase n=1 Tax=Hahella ganghwensis TaxID=286420 RepID=UPI0003655222|nr:biliverdin-producing heme oxygenase [Hahella ganghwensis]